MHEALVCPYPASVTLPLNTAADTGQTYFIGSQPVHTYFFYPEYKPQFLPSGISLNSGSIIIDKALIHEYALRESGLGFDVTQVGKYILDGRLQYVRRPKILLKVELTFE